MSDAKETKTMNVKSDKSSLGFGSDTGGMTTEAHTPEPWKFNDVLGGCSVHAGNREVLAYYYSPDAENKANARRLTACVNACTGIPTYQLFGENETPNNLGGMIDALRQQRDDLLAACKDALADGNEGDWQSARSTLERAIEPASRLTEQGE